MSISNTAEPVTDARTVSAQNIRVLAVIAAFLLLVSAAVMTVSIDVDARGRLVPAIERGYSHHS